MTWLPGDDAGFLVLFRETFRFLVLLPLSCRKVFPCLIFLCCQTKIWNRELSKVKITPEVGKMRWLVLTWTSSSGQLSVLTDGSKMGRCQAF